ncbi:S-layer homology domain-containing protein [Paenibacillus methanolicus]|uniref:S-layer family protein n=1 Tax=Paenibacillus methanolicus TaxID=582686 RepID=A0A5S5CCH8_9BACL|nr:S-layer homology domain-containing protein [Paenibacillus methanolicus]TYP75703.1 S-layer family protein [Paenibacillus methanolicus]
MKKSLSAILATSMAFSMFASAAFAADPLTTEAKFQEMKTAGIFQGINGESHLDQLMTRAEFAKALATLLKLENKPAAAASFKDVSATHWAIGQIGALAEAKIIEGVGAGQFGPKVNVSLEQVAKIAATALKLELKADAKVEGKTSAWATQYVAAAVAAGLIKTSADYTVNATRGDLVDASFVVYQKSVVKTLEATAKLAGAKKVEVKFNQAVDTSKVTFEIKNATGSVVNINKTTFADDKQTATLEMVSNLLKGEYTITAKSGETTLTSKVTVEDEKVAKIEFLSEKAAISRTDKKEIQVAYKITNQYGEDVTKTKTGGVTFTAAPSTSVSPDATKGVLTIKNTAADYVIDQKVSVTALDSSSTTFASAIVSVSNQANVQEITVKKIVNTVDNTKTLSVSSDPAEYVLVVEAKDQYGNVITNPDILRDDVIVTSTNNYVVDKAVVDVDADPAKTNFKPNFKELTIDGTKELTIALANGSSSKLTAGTSKFYLSPIYSGKTVTYDVTVKDSIKVDTLTLSAPTLAPAGEKIEIPFTAVDQFGNAITKASDLNAGINGSITVNTPNGNVSATFVQDYVKNTAKLVVDATSVTLKGAGSVSVLTGTNKHTYTTFNFVDKAEATVIAGFKSDAGYSANLAKEATTTLKPGDISIKDQYGRDFTPAWGTGAGQYSVKIENSDATKVTSSETVIDASGDASTFTGVAKGSATVTLTLQKAGALVANSAYSYNARVVEKADITSYELADISTLYSSKAGTAVDAAYARDVKVNGVLSDGKKVAVPTSYYNGNVVVTGENVDFAGGKVGAFGNVGFDSAGNKEVTIAVTVDANGGPVNLSKVVKVSTTAPKVTKFELVTNGSAKKEDTLVLSASAAAINAGFAAVIKDGVKTTDQYGTELTGAAEAFTPVATTLPTGKTTATVVAGDTFNAVIYDAAGTPTTIKVVVTA